MPSDIEDPKLVVNECMSRMLATKDALEILSSKWKIPIIASLMTGPKRFKQIGKEVGGITDKMLSKELKDLELNLLVKRTVHDTFPPAVEYAITEHGKSLESVVMALYTWGAAHRNKVFGKE
jgi:DNA-binding HxlR family transcriptional regulator